MFWLPLLVLLLSSFQLPTARDVEAAQTRFPLPFRPPRSPPTWNRYVGPVDPLLRNWALSLIKLPSLSWGFFGSTAEFYPRHLYFCGQARHEVTQPLLRSTANAIDVAFLRSFTVHLTCQLVRGLLRVCYSVFLSSFEIYCFCYTTTHIRLVYQFIC